MPFSRHPQARALKRQVVAKDAENVRLKKRIQLMERREQDKDEAHAALVERMATMERALLAMQHGRVVCTLGRNLS